MERAKKSKQNTKKTVTVMKMVTFPKFQYSYPYLYVISQ